MPTTKSNVFFLLYFAASVCLRGGGWAAGGGWVRRVAGRWQWGWGAGAGGGGLGPGANRGAGACGGVAGNPVT